MDIDSTNVYAEPKELTNQTNSDQLSSCLPTWDLLFERPIDELNDLMLTKRIDQPNEFFQRFLDQWLAYMHWYQNVDQMQTLCLQPQSCYSFLLTGFTANGGLTTY